MTTAAEIMIRAGRILQDEDATRWTYVELADWITEAQRAIVLAQPSALSRTVVLPLAAGTRQVLPGHTTPKFSRLLALERNLASAEEPRVGRRIIRPTTRALLDASEPDWQDPRSVRPSAEVRQYIFDEAVPLEFLVYPPNNGQGVVEAAVSVSPSAIAPDGDVAQLASWSQPLDLPEAYDGPVLDYTLFRAHSKDSDGAQADRAAAHYQLFAQAIGLKVGADSAASPNSRRGVTQQ